MSALPAEMESLLSSLVPPALCGAVGRILVEMKFTKIIDANAWDQQQHYY